MTVVGAMEEPSSVGKRPGGLKVRCDVGVFELEDSVEVSDGDAPLAEAKSCGGLVGGSVRVSVPYSEEKNEDWGDGE